jgi:branched-chain amino acid transport system permease protein
MQGMDTEDWVITVLRGLSVGALTFLVAAGLSLILGLMDVLNLAHGETFMLGAYVGWTVFVRPDTFVDLLTPVLLLSVGFVLLPLWRALLAGLIVPRWLPWLSAILGLLILAVTLLRFPIAIWNLDVYTESPVTYSLAADQGNLVLPEPPDFAAVSPFVAIVGTLLGGCLLALAGAGWQRSVMLNRRVGKRPIILAAVVLFVALLPILPMMR